MNFTYFSFNVAFNYLSIFGLSSICAFVFHLYNKEYIISDFKNEYKIYLDNNNHKYTRENIIQIGRMAIRDKNTNIILEHPVVNINGDSINTINYNNDIFYKNRLLNNLIKQFK